MRSRPPRQRWGSWCWSWGCCWPWGWCWSWGWCWFWGFICSVLIKVETTTGGARKRRTSGRRGTLGGVSEYFFLFFVSVQDLKKPRILTWIFFSRWECSRWTTTDFFRRGRGRRQTTRGLFFCKHLFPFLWPVYHIFGPFCPIWWTCIVLLAFLFSRSSTACWTMLLIYFLQVVHRAEAGVWGGGYEVGGLITKNQ